VQLVNFFLFLIMAAAERMAAMQIARSRELLNWFGAFYSLAALGMVAGFR
jgi:hypothetical protein